MVWLQGIAHAKAFDDVARRARTDRTVCIPYRVAQLHLLAVVKEPCGIAHDLGIERVVYLVALFRRCEVERLAAIDRNQKRVQVQIVKVRGTPAHLAQEIRAADDLIEGPRADGRKDLTYFLRVKCDEVHNLVRIASELRAQALVLRTDTDRAGVRLTLTHHNAAHRDQCGGADPELFRAHHGSHDDVTPSPQTSICAECHAPTQVVHRQNLMRFRQTHFPRQTSIFDRRRRRGSRSTVVA